jgi:signal transduction histidine kinase/ActR/RegA family two-component response regulator
MQFCVAISSVFLLWGSLRFLDLPVPQSLFGLFMLFLLIWTYIGKQLVISDLQIQLPVFILLGLGSIFAGVCFFRLRRHMPFVGAGMLALGFTLWGLYLSTWPLSQTDGQLKSTGFFVAAVLQLFIAVSMIVLVLEEVRFKNEQVLAEIAAVRSEKDALRAKVITTEEKCQSLYDQVRLTEGAQKAYDELRHTQHVVVQQERLRALGQMASGIAHDINNALSPIVAYSDLLLTTLPDLPHTSRRHLENIHKSAADIAQIVARMREFYRPRSDTEELASVDLNKVIHDAIELTRPRWRDLPQRHGINIHVDTNLSPDLPPLLGDQSEVREALTNLVFNAVDALPQGGTITFTTRIMDRPGPKTGEPATPHLILEVRDNGVGMDEKTRQRCFEPFFSTKAQRGGTGLGLAMVYGMMQRHEGVIEIESTPGQGTCIRLCFPVVKPTAPPVPAEPKAVTCDTPVKVLCIDDEPMVRQLLDDCLKRYKHDVAVASDGKQGLEMFRTALRSNQPYQVVITDLGMPEVDGEQVARSIKAESPKTPVIMLTGWGTMMKEDTDVSTRVDAVVPKPPRMKELNDLVVQFAKGPERQF